jgi:Domain of unknown function (DUF4136)
MRRNRGQRLLLATALMLAASAPGVAEKGGRHDFDPAFDFTGLEAFDFRVPESRQQEGSVAQELLPKLEALLDEVLGAKGYRRDSEAPDFVVMFDGQIAEIIIPNSGVYVDVSDRVVWEVPDNRGQVGSSRGLLAVRMTAPGEKEPFWWAADDAKIDGKITAAKVWKKAEPLARRILDRFPARGTAPAALAPSAD